MIVRKIDIENDWLFGKGRNDYLSANDAIAQNVKTRLQSFLGDCFFDISAGIDWFNRLGSKNKLQIQLDVNAVILNTPGVTGIVDSSFSIDSNRKITLQYSINTVYTERVSYSTVVRI